MATTQIDLTTAFQDVSAIVPGRSVYLVPGNATPAGQFSIVIEVGEALAATEGVIVATLTGNVNRYFSLPNDSSKFMRYRIINGVVGASTKVWVTG